MWTGVSEENLRNSVDIRYSVDFISLRMQHHYTENAGAAPV